MYYYLMLSLKVKLKVNVKEIEFTATAQWWSAVIECNGIGAFVGTLQEVEWSPIYLSLM